MPAGMGREACCPREAPSALQATQVNPRGRYMPGHVPDQLRCAIQRVDETLPDFVFCLCCIRLRCRSLLASVLAHACSVCFDAPPSPLTPTIHTDDVGKVVS